MHGKEVHRTSKLAQTAAFIATFAVSVGALGDDSTELRIRQVEDGLLPRVTLKENLGRTASITQRMSDLGIPGVSIAVIDGGKVVWARGYGAADNVEKTPVTAGTLFQAGSISKPVAALGALRLVSEGKLSLDEDVNAKLVTWRIPDNEFTRDEKVTLRRLMSHTAGLTVHGFPGYPMDSQLPTVVQVLNGQPPANTPPVRVDLRPGSAYRYSGGGYTVMQVLIADVSGDTFESFMQSKVLDVLGMRSSTYMQSPQPALAARRASGHRWGGERIPGKLHLYPEMAAAGLWTTPTDLAQYLLYVQAAVRGDPGLFIDASLARELVARQNGGAHGLGPEIYATGEFARFGHNGVDEGFEASAVAYVARGQGLVVMANANRASMFFDEVKASVARAYGWPGFPARPQIEVGRVPPFLLERMPGTYRTDGMTAVVSARNGRLFVALLELGVAEAFAASATELITPGFGLATFQWIEANGRITGLKTSDGRVLQRID